MATWDLISIGAAAAAGFVGTVDVDPGTIESFGKWPVTIALVGLAAFSQWLAHRTLAQNSKSVDHLADNIGKLTENLAQRPCVRSPKND